MARDFGQVRLSIWNDDDFIDLTPAAQHLYIVLLSSPGLSWVGVNDWRPGRLCSRANGWSKRDVIQAAGELARALFIVIDPDTEEVLVRSFVRNDGFMKQPNLATSMARSFAVVGSRKLQGIIVHELQRLKEEHPDIAGWKSEEASNLLKKRAIDPSVDPQFDPSVEGGVDPSVHPSIDPSVEGERNPSVDPSVDPSPTTATTTSPTSRAGNRRGKGGLGEKGNPDVAQVEESSPPIDPPDSLDALAAAHAARHDPERCDAHQGIAEENVPNCWACANARKTHRAKLDAEAKQAGQSRRAQIDACPECDDNGWILIDGAATKCTHHHERKSA